MSSELTSDDDGALEATDGSSQDADTKHALEEQATRQRYPGCFKKAVAFIIDEIIIAVIGIVVFFPFSRFIYSLHQHAWLPGFLVGGVYFAILESSVFRGRSFGKRVFSLRVTSIEGKEISPFISFGRYLLVTLPFMNREISNTLASTVGITNTLIGGIIFLVIVAVLCSGNLFLRVGKNPDFADINALSDRIRQASSIRNISVSYGTFTSNSRLLMFAIEVHVPVPYDRFADKNFTDRISNELYPLAKELNTNPKVDNVTIVFHARKYFGAVPISKTMRTPRKLSEIILDPAEQQP